MSTVWSDTFSLMLLGMGTVFVFLLTLIVALYILSSVMRRFSIEEESAEDASLQVKNEEITAAAAAAHYFHNRYK